MVIDEPKAPEGMTEKHLKFIDGLHKNGEMDIHRVGRCLQGTFRLNSSQVHAYLAYWIDTFKHLK